MAFGRKKPDPLPAFDPYEYGARRSDPDLGSLEPLLPLPPPRFSPKQLLVAFFALVLVVAFLRDGLGKGPPRLATSCDRGALALSSSSLRPFSSLAWSATGPAASKVVLGLDVTSTTTAPSTVGEGLLAGPVDLPQCRASGRFGVRAADGTHLVTMFLVAPDGSTTVVATKRISVDAR